MEQDDLGAILDNTLFGYDENIAAKKFFGKITIHNWRELYRQDDSIMTDNREGLDYNNNSIKY
jgi:hypothetical protein